MAHDQEIRVERSDPVTLKNGEDVVRLRQAVRERAVAVGFSLVDQTKIVTAASELGRNTIQYGGGGEATVEVVANGTRRGVRLGFVDQGPGIPDIPQAMKEGFTSGGGLGLGLPGARRLSDEFHIESTPGKGTRVVIVRWKPY
jgi:serine/threonine-protein kinase RsbT